MQICPVKHKCVEIDGHIYHLDENSPFAFRMTLKVIQGTTSLPNSLVHGVLKHVMDAAYYSIYNHEFEELDFNAVKEAIQFYFYEHCGVEREWDSLEAMEAWGSYTFKNYMICVFHAKRIEHIETKYDSTWRITDKTDKVLFDESYDVIKQISSTSSYYPDNSIHYIE